MNSRPASAVTMATAVLSLLSLGLAGCGGNAPPQTTNYANPASQTGTPGNLAGDPSLALNVGNHAELKNQQGAASLGVNAYLWRGALDTLSFMPLASADPFGGVIITDWFSPPATPGERFKATAYILGRELRADGIRVAVFRQTMQGGQWTDADVAPNTATDIENKVLARARELRSQNAG